MSLFVGGAQKKERKVGGKKRVSLNNTFSDKSPEHKKLPTQVLGCHRGRYVGQIISLQSKLYPDIDTLHACEERYPTADSQKSISPLPSSLSLPCSAR